MNKSPVKLLVLVSAFARHRYDSGDLTSRLQQYNIAVTVLAPHDEGLKFQETIKGMKIYRFPYFYPFTLQKLAYGGGMPYNLKKSLLAKIQVPFFLLAEAVAAIKIIKEVKPDIIQSHWLIPQGLIGAICQKYYHVPNLSTIHSSEITLLKKMPLSQKIANFIITNSQHIVSVSHHRLEELNHYLKEKNKEKIKKQAEIIPMGINVGEFRGLTKEGKYNLQKCLKVLFVGRLVEVKGCEYLIKAFTLIKKKIPYAQLDIVGNGPLEKSLRELVTDLDLGKQVNFIGYIDHKKVKKYYSCADIVVFPSIIDAAGYQEGLPVVLLEALASGKPIIATKTKGTMEVIHDGYNGFLVKPKDSKDMARKILNVFEKRNLREIKLNALKSAQKYDWKNVARRYSKVIKNIAN